MSDWGFVVCSQFHLAVSNGLSLCFTYRLLVYISCRPWNKQKVRATLNGTRGCSTYLMFMETLGAFLLWISAWELSSMHSSPFSAKITFALLQVGVSANCTMWILSTGVPIQKDKKYFSIPQLPVESWTLKKMSSGGIICNHIQLLTFVLRALLFCLGIWALACLGCFFIFCFLPASGDMLCAQI